MENSLPHLKTLRTEWAVDGVLLVRIDRPDNANSISAQLCRDLLELADHAVAEESLRAVVLTGEGRFFCAGADLRDPEYGPAWIGLARRTLESFAHISVPTIAAVNGIALGGGTELILTCDVRMASMAAKFGLPEIRLGALPGGGGLSRLQQVVGPVVARDLLFTGRHIQADEALRIGLVSKVHEPEALVDSAITYAAEIAQYARYALATAKFVLNASFGMPMESALQVEYSALDHMATPEQRHAELRRAGDRDPTYARILARRPQQ